MKKASNLIEERRKELKSQEEKLWNNFHDKSKSGKLFKVNKKQLAIAAAGIAGGFLLFKAMTGSKNDKATTRVKTSRKSSTGVKIIGTVLNKAIPAIIDKLEKGQKESKEENQK